MTSQEPTQPMSAREEKHTVKCVVVGDKVAEKTVLLITYTTNQYPPGGYVATVSYTSSVCDCWLPLLPVE